MRQVLAGRRETHSMSTDRLEAFSDGVIAIIITIMVLEFKVPHGADWHALQSLSGVAISYVLSFIYIGIYWNNHHHMMHAVEKINGATLWANLHLLFWLSLVPFTTGWMGENSFATLPVAVYGANLMMCGVAYAILVRALMRAEGPDSIIARAFRSDFKGKVSVLLYCVAIPLAFVNRWLALAVYVAVALIWFVPDKRIENHLDA